MAGSPTGQIIEDQKKQITDQLAPYLPSKTKPKQKVLAAIPRYMGWMTADAVLEERHADRLISTEHPVEQGSSITDHAYVMPARLTLTYAWSMNSPFNTGGSQSFLQFMYNTVLQAQSERVPMRVATGKRLYENMLIEDVDCTTDSKRENMLELRISLKEILYATTTVVPIQNPKNMQQTGPIIPQGVANILFGGRYVGNLDVYGKTALPEWAIPAGPTTP
jgi:hypothetical protein